MKKAIFCLTLAFVLSLSTTLLLVNSVMANPVWFADVPYQPITTPPTISVSSPAYNETYLSPEVVLSFKIQDPQRWYMNYVPNVYPTDTMPYWGNMVVGNVTSVYYDLNGEQQNLSVPEIQAFVPPKNGSLPATYLSYSIPLNLTNGQYTIQIYVEASSFYMPSLATGILNTTVSAVSQPIYFAVKFPQPIILAPERITYNESNVPLQFTIGGSSASWIGYSLDNKANVTITGNTTLTGLTNGEHYLTVYTNDTLGNSYASQTISFFVALRTNASTNTILEVSATIVVVIAIGVIVYFRKRTHNHKG